MNVHESILYKLLENISHNHPKHESVSVLHAASRTLLAEWHPNERRSPECLCGITKSGTATDGKVGRDTKWSERGSSKCVCCI